MYKNKKMWKKNIFWKLGMARTFFCGRDFLLLYYYDLDLYHIFVSIDYDVFYWDICCMYTILIVGKGNETIKAICT